MLLVSSLLCIFALCAKNKVCGEGTLTAELTILAFLRFSKGD